jgi:WD40 repeat protein
MYFQADKARDKEAVARTEAVAARDIAEQAEGVAQQSRKDAQRRLVRSQIERGVRFLNEGNGLGLLDLLDARVIAEEIPELRDQVDRLWAIAYELWAGQLVYVMPYTEAMAFSEDGRFFATQTNEGVSQLWDMATGHPVEETLKHKGTMIKLPDEANRAALSPEGKMVANIGWDKTTRIWRTYRQVHTEIVHYQSGVELGAISRDGRVGAIVSGETVQLWDTMTVKALGEPLRPGGLIAAVAFSPEGTVLATASEDQCLLLWDVASGEPFASAFEEGLLGNLLTFSPDGKLLAAGGGSRGWVVTVWEIASGRRLYSIWPSGRVCGLSFSPDGKFLAVGLNTLRVTLWDAATGQKYARPLQHKGPVRAVAYSPDGSLLATISGDRAQTVQVWEVGTGPPYHSLVLPFQAVGRKAVLSSFSSAGEIIVSKSRDGTAHVWRVPVPPTNLREVQLRTWVALGAQHDRQGQIIPIPWDQWQKLHEELYSLVSEAEKGKDYYVPIGLEPGRQKVEQLFVETLRNLWVQQHVLGEGHPDTIASIKKLAWLQATCPAAEFRNGAKAIESATKACRLTNWNKAEYIGTLAAGYAAADDFATAVKWQKKAIDLLPEDERAKWKANYEERLRLYESGKSYHDKGVPWRLWQGHMVAWWKFDRSEDSNVMDSSGSGINGKLVGGATIVPDTERGNVLSLDGGGYVDCGDNSRFDITGSITITTWIKVNVFDKRCQAIVTKGDTAWRIHRDQNENNIEFPCNGLGLGFPGSGMASVGGSVNVNDGQWHHVAGVYDGVTIYLYVDGLLESAEHTWGNIDTNNEPVYIGENSEEPGREWNGLIDDVRIYSCALSGREIKEICAGQSPLGDEATEQQRVIMKPAVDSRASVRGDRELLLGVSEQTAQNKEGAYKRAEEIRKEVVPEKTEDSNE